MQEKFKRLDKKVKGISLHQDELKQKMKKVIKDIKPITERENAKIEQKELILRKAIIKPQFNRKTVLTDSHWHFIELLLRSSKKDNCQEALNYWNQAKNFYQATLNLDLVSKPLTTYYCFLNATKALLTFKQIDFDKKHGISGESQDGQVKLQNELIKLHKKGVLAGLCEYLDEPIIINQINKPLLKNSVMRTLKNDIFRQNKRYIKEGLEQTFFDKLEHYLNTRNKTEAQPEIYTLKDILYNLEFVHRAYKLTFPRSSELFIPVIKPRFVFDKNTNKAWLELQLEKEYSNKRVLNLMDEFEIDEYYQTDRQKFNKIDWKYSLHGFPYTGPFAPLQTLGLLYRVSLLVSLPPAPVIQVHVVPTCQ